MKFVWIAVALMAVGVVAVVVRRLVTHRDGSRANLDVGSVSEGWLSEQQSRKDS